jgi:hypothetical protein
MRANRDTKPRDAGATCVRAPLAARASAPLLPPRLGGRPWWPFTNGQKKTKKKPKPSSAHFARATAYRVLGLRENGRAVSISSSCTAHARHRAGWRRARRAAADAHLRRNGLNFVNLTGV